MLLPKNARKIIFLAQDMRFAIWDELDLEKGMWKISVDRIEICRLHLVYL